MKSRWLHTTFSIIKKIVLVVSITVGGLHLVGLIAQYTIGGPWPKSVRLKNLTEEQVALVKNEIKFDLPPNATVIGFSCGLGHDSRSVACISGITDVDEFVEYYAHMTNIEHGTKRQHYSKTFDLYIDQCIAYYGDNTLRDANDKKMVVYYTYNDTLYVEISTLSLYEKDTYKLFNFNVFYRLMLGID